MKIAVLHDFFEIKGGGERLVLTLAKHLQADLFFGFWSSTSYALEGVRAHSLNAQTNIIGWRTVKQIRAFKQLKNLDQYDVVIYSGNDALFARPNRTRRGNIFYCHTPPRHLYDQREFFRRYKGLLGKVFLHILEWYQRPRYERLVRSMDLVLTNSQNTQERIQKYLATDSEVVYPPCNIETFRWIDQKDFYLSTARLDNLKNVDRIVHAFQQMPDKKLVIVSGGVHENKIRLLANSYPNITVLGWVDEGTLQHYLGSCIATIYIPDDEDFGMSPVESMASGKPVIGVASGGLKETILHKKTGCLLRPDFTDAHMVEMIQWMSPERALSMREACEAQAKLFSETMFLEHMDAIISRYRV